jgi:multiple antibiotic resistance protein
MLCLGVQIVWDGAHELLLGLLAEAARHVPVPQV